MPNILRTVKDENPNNPGSTIYYDDGTSSFTPTRVNPQGLTVDQMIAKGNIQSPVNASVVYNPDGTRSLSATDKYWQDNPIQTNDEFKAQQERIKSDFAKRQQEAIDSINNMYVSILSRAEETGRDKLGSANVINALSGQRGSASGAANIDKVNKSNDEIYQGVLAEKQNKINAIMNATYKDQTEELRYQNDLRRQDLDKYLSYMGQKETDNIAKSKAMRAELIGSNIDINDIEPDTLQRMAEAAGYTVEQFKVLYESERKKTQDEFLKNEEKRLLDIEKTKLEIDKMKEDPVAKALIDKGYLPITDPKQLEGLKESQITRVGEKIFKNPMGELDIYEAKKKIDSKYKVSSSNNQPESETPEEKQFRKDLQKETDNLISNGSWGESYDRLASRYPDLDRPLTNDERIEYGAQDDDETLIDVVLNKSKYFSQSGKKTESNSGLNYNDF